jgi:uncharacterized protein YcfJ
MRQRTAFKSLIGTTALAAGLTLTGLAQASSHYAKVISVEPIYEQRVTPIQRTICEEQPVIVRTQERPSSATPTVIGAIIGGVVGSQFGGGSGQKAATVAGAVLGGSIGRDAGRANAPSRYEASRQQHCHVERHSTTETVQSGYRVTYEYDGRLFRTQTRHHPGSRLVIQDVPGWH